MPFLYLVRLKELVRRFAGVAAGGRVLGDFFSCALPYINGNDPSGDVDGCEDVHVCYIPSPLANVASTLHSLSLFSLSLSLSLSPPLSPSA